MVFTERDSIAVAQICVYTISLAIAVLLSIRHGFGRNAGWLYMIIFSLVRIVGGGLVLATISQPTNIGLAIGASIVSSIGLSPLLLIQLGLLGRAVDSIRRTNPSTFLNRNRMRIVQLIIIVGLVLTAVGGSNSGNDYGSTGVYKVSTLSEAGMGLIILGFALLVLATALVATQISHAEPGEKRLVLAVGLSLPFLLVRIAYSSAVVFANSGNFNALSPNINIQLGMDVVMEMIVVAIVEAFGLTLGKAAPAPPEPASSGRPRRHGENQHKYEMAPYEEAGNSRY